MYTDTAVNNMLTAEGTTHLSLHTDYSATGANEVTGGSPAYARKAATWGTAASRAKALSAELTFDVPASTIKWIGRWTALTGGTFLGMGPLQGSEKQFTVDPATDVFRAAGHTYLDGDQVVFYAGTVPAPLVEGTAYFVRDKTTDTFKVAATAGGAAIDITAQASAACVLSRIVPATYTAQGTLKVPTTFTLRGL
jgi:hypothetical protein